MSPFSREAILCGNAPAAKSMSSALGPTWAISFSRGGTRRAYRPSPLRRWPAGLNRNKTRFLLPPTTPVADETLQMSMPAREFPFAGHPSLVRARAWLPHGGKPRSDSQIMPPSAVGLVRLRPAETRLAFLRAAGAPESGASSTAGRSSGSGAAAQPSWKARCSCI